MKLRTPCEISILFQYNTLHELLYVLHTQAAVEIIFNVNQRENEVLLTKYVLLPGLAANTFFL